VRAAGKPATPAKPAAATHNAAAPKAAADVEPARPLFAWGGKRPVGRTETAELAVQLAVMLDAGVPLTQALEGLQEGASKPHVREALRAVLEDVQAGNDLSTAVARCPWSFPPVFSRLLRAGEASGQMGQTIARAGEYLQGEVETVRRIRGALAYPVIMLCLAVVAMGLVFGFLLPRFETMYSSRKAALPAPTKIALAISHFLRDHWVVLAVGAVLVVTGIVLYVRSEHGRATMDWLKLHCPLLKRMFRQLYVSRSFQTLGTTVAAGVTLLEAVRLSRDVAGNRYFAHLWDQAEAHLQAGKRLADPLFATDLVSKTVAQMVATGERSGNLAMVMQQIAALCERELQHTVKTVTSMLEPIMIIVLGGVVGGIVMTILLPIFRLARSMN
jgi:type IV pilus assembly protein PilC